MASGLVAEKFRYSYTEGNALFRKLPDHGSCFFTYLRQTPSALSFGTPGPLLVRLVCYPIRDWDYSRHVAGSTGNDFREHFSGLGNLIAASYWSNVRSRSVLHFGIAGGIAPRYAASILTVRHQVNSSCLKRSGVVDITHEFSSLPMSTTPGPWDYYCTVFTPEELSIAKLLVDAVDQTNRLQGLSTRPPAPPPVCFHFVLRSHRRAGNHHRRYPDQSRPQCHCCRSRRVLCALPSGLWLQSFVLGVESIFARLL